MDIVDAIRGYHFLARLAVEIAEYAYDLNLLDFKYFKYFDIDEDTFFIEVSNATVDYFDNIRIPLVCINQNTWGKYLSGKAREKKEEKEKEAQLKEQEELEEYKRLKEKYEKL